MRAVNWLVCAVLLLASGAFADVPPIPNGDFGRGEIGKTPEGWVAPIGGIEAVIVERNGARAVSLTSASKSMANFMQQVDAAPYRGRNVILTVRIAVMGEGARAQPWIRVDRGNEVVGWFDNCGDRPVAAGKEETVLLSGRVDDDAKLLNVGVMVFGPATVILQPVKIEEGRLASTDLPPAPLSDRGLANLTAFAHIFGQIKYFHPSESAFKADWTTLAIAGVQRIEPCASSKELAAALSEVFGGVGAGVQFWVDGDAPPVPAAADAVPKEGRVIGWVHDGIAFGPEYGNAGAGRNVYKSARVKEPGGAPAAGKARKLPAVGAFMAGSAGGVSWRIPAVLSVDSRGFAPQADSHGVLPTDLRAGKGFRPSGNDRATRLADVVIAWNLFEHFYPYFDTVKTDWPATLTRSLKQAATDEDDRAFLRTLRMLVADLHDGHGSVYQNALMPQKGLPCGWRFVGDDLIVTSAGSKEENTDSFRAGDRILKVDGRTAADFWAQWRPQTSAATDQWARYAIARSLLLYAPSNDPSTVEVDRNGETLTLKVPLVPMAKLRMSDPERPADGAVVGTIDGRQGTNGEVLYFNLSDAKEEAFKAALEKLSTAGGLVFDLRGYPDSAATTVLRHLTDVEIRSAKWIIPSVTLPGGVNGGGWEWVESKGRWSLPPLQPRLGAPGQPVVFITDGRAISYAESIMGIVEAYKLGEIVGGATAGTNGNVNPFTLPGGYSLSWTGMRVIKHDGSTHHGVGIIPTVPCEPTRAGIAAGRDEVLEKAVAVIKEKAGK